MKVKRNRTIASSYDRPFNDDDFELDGEVDTQDNNIYFYAGVNEKSVMQLNKSLHKIRQDAVVHAAKQDTKVHGKAKLFVQSYGGSVLSGLSAMDTVRSVSKDIEVWTVVDGGAASAATFVSVVGSHRQMYRNSFMLIHQLSSGYWGKYEEMRDEMSNLDSFMQTIYGVYDQYAKIPKKELKELLKRDIWWGAHTCLKYGLIDEII